MRRSLDDPGRPLVDVTFVVVDLETTGGSASDDAITEIGAVRLRGGECLATLQTLVDPGVAIPPSISYLTGITESMVAPAPPIEDVLPTLVEFIGDAVLVGHNVAFDLRFLNANLVRHGAAPLPNRVVDTCALARRLVREEVANCKLATLADRFGLPHRPRHRALDDALATGDLLHALLERAGSLGVVGLEELLELPTVKGHPQLQKLRLAADLPRAPGVYLFRDATGRVLYVGKAVDLRRRVRSYFSGAGDDRRKIGPMLRSLARIDHVVCAGELEAAVLEVRLIHRYAPHYNRQAKLWERYVYVKLTGREVYPRLSVVRATPADGGLYLGPVASVRAAGLVVEAIETAVPLRRCRARVPASARPQGPCTPAQLGVSVCPCAGATTPDAYAIHVATTVAGLTTSPRLLLDPLGERIAALAASGRFEEAATARDRAGALARALTRQRRLSALRAAGRLVLDLPDGRRAILDRGRLVGPLGRSAPAGAVRLPLDEDVAAAAIEADEDRSAGQPVADTWPEPVPRHLVDELLCVLQWLDRNVGRVAIRSCDRGLAWPAGRIPDFSPVERRAA